MIKFPTEWNNKYSKAPTSHGPCTSISSPPHTHRTSPERIRREASRRWEPARRDRGATNPPADTPPGRPGSTVSLVKNADFTGKNCEW